MKLFYSLLFSIASLSLIAQNTNFPDIHVDKITIARDSYGVPHIFAPTDPEVAYGLAWAHAEDDFKTIQTLILTGKGKLSTYMGKEGAPVDFVFGLLNTRATVDQQIKSMDPKFIQLLQGYLMGLQAYGKAHPKEILNKHVFPINVEDYIATTMFSVAVFCGVDKTLPKILNGSIANLPGFKEVMHLPSAVKNRPLENLCWLLTHINPLKEPLLFMKPIYKVKKVGTC